MPLSSPGQGERRAATPRPPSARAPPVSPPLSTSQDKAGASISAAATWAYLAGLGVGSPQEEDQGTETRAGGEQEYGLPGGYRGRAGVELLEEAEDGVGGLFQGAYSSSTGTARQAREGG